MALTYWRVPHEERDYLHDGAVETSEEADERRPFLAHLAQNDAEENGEDDETQNIAACSHRSLGVRPWMKRGKDT